MAHSPVYSQTFSDSDSDREIYLPRHRYRQQKRGDHNHQSHRDRPQQALPHRDRSPRDNRDYRDQTLYHSKECDGDRSSRYDRHDHLSQSRVDWRHEMRGQRHEMSHTLREESRESGMMTERTGGDDSSEGKHSHRSISERRETKKGKQDSEAQKQRPGAVSSHKSKGSKERRRKRRRHQRHRHREMVNGNDLGRRPERDRPENCDDKSK